jgi:hypothetical protein
MRWTVEVRVMDSDGERGVGRVMRYFLDPL